MAAFDFPNAPTVGQVYTPSGGPAYIWNGTTWTNVGFAQSAYSVPRNRVVNPAMQINQPAAGLITVAAGVPNYAVDNWTPYQGSDATVTVQQIDGPAGAAVGRKRLQFKVTVIDAALAAGQYFQILSPIEGLDVADLGFGAANASPVTVRLGVKFPAGTYGVCLMNSAGSRSWMADMVIAAGEANTDVVKTFVIPGDVTGTWLTDTGVGMSLRVILAVGSTYQGVAGWNGGSSLMGTANVSNGMAALNTFELFDVGLYKGNVAPVFEVPNYADELRRCKRYWQLLGTMLACGYQSTGGMFYVDWPLEVEMRIVPTVTYVGINYNNASALVTNSVYAKHIRVGFTVTATGMGYAWSDITLNSRFF
jgi:hypothetical protein